MSDAVRDLEPQSLWNYFADLNAVPRASKKEAEVIAFARAFGESLGLPTHVDATGNVIIRKAATSGMEAKTPVVLQSHLDMVHQKNADTQFDFATEGIKMLVDGDFVKAEGTTLGADNGIGVAAIMAILAAKDLPHPPLEALFTVDEETGMTGAKGLEGGLLQGKILLNLDTEDDRELTIGCAGGVDVTCQCSYDTETVPEGWVARNLALRGLQGGHSGMDIHLGRGNANKLMNRILWQAAEQFGLRIAALSGGGLRNAIPRESFATVVVDGSAVAAFETFVKSEAEVLKAEYQTTDPQLEIAIESTALPPGVLPERLQFALLAGVYACTSGIFRMSPDVPGLVQTSNNLARVAAQEGQLQIACLTRSSVNSERDDLARGLMAAFAPIGGDLSATGSYPGWKPAPESAIVTIMSQLYHELFGDEPHVSACHAGLECGILGQNYETLDMISFGPNIYGAHSPDERVQISSVQKFWKFLLETLHRIP